MLPQDSGANSPSPPPMQAIVGYCLRTAILATMLVGVSGRVLVAGETGSIEQPVAGVSKALSTLKIYGTDDRQAVGDTTQFPWSAIGVLRATWNLDNGQKLMSNGTGALIGYSVVLTGGHCVYDQTAGWADEVVFIPGKNEGQEPFGQARSIRLISQRNWVESDDHRFDLALVVLDKPLGLQAGFFDYAAKPNSFFVDRLLNTAGYPADTKSGNVQYFTSGSSLDVVDGFIREMLDSEPGQSGSPIWYYETEPATRTLVGVLIGSRQTSGSGLGGVTDYNVAVKIDDGFVQWINETLTKYDTSTHQDAAARTDVWPPTPACGVGFAGAGTLVAGLICLRVVSGKRCGSLHRITFHNRQGAH